MAIVLAKEDHARVGARVEGAYGRTAACEGCPLQRVCRNRPERSFGVVQAVRDAPWKLCRLYGRVRAVEVQVYPGEGPRPPKRRPLRVVLDTNALDHPAIREALGDSRFEFVLSHAIAQEAARAPWRREVAWDAFRLVGGEPRDPHVLEARPAAKHDAPSEADRTVMQAALDVRADIVVSDDRHITEAALEGRARTLGQTLRILRPREFAKVHLGRTTCRGART